MNQPGSFKTLDDWLPWLETLSPREIELGLGRIRLVLDRLDLQRPPLVISVAGTNGKGSSAAMLEALLGKGGMKTGCYSSPHVSRYNERTRIGGQPASDALLLSSLERVEAVRDDVPLSFFEFGTLTTLVAFNLAETDAWILEVGLGGRLDAVNAVDPDASLITNISLDHCAWLGNDIESIAREKAGVMRPGKPVIFGSANLPAAIEAAALALGAKLQVAGRDFSYENGSGNTQEWSWRGTRLRISKLGQLAMPGTAQKENASAALATLEALKLDQLLTRETVNAALAEVALPGRFQIIERRCRWILDVAHNPGAVTVLADLLARQNIDGKITAVVGMLADKDIAGVIGPLCGLVDNWIAVTVAGARAETATDLAAKVANVCGTPCRIAASITEALNVAGEISGQDDAVLVFGSFYLVGPALDWLGISATESA